MTKVVAQANMSLDGYVAKQDNTIGNLSIGSRTVTSPFPPPPGISPSTSPKKTPSTGVAGCHPSAP